MKAIILNGPPRSGKDTLLVELEKYFAESHKDKHFEPFSYKRVLCEGVGTRYGVDPLEVWEINADADSKDKPSKLFGGKTVREALIYESENVIKVDLGEHGVAIKTFMRLSDKLKQSKVNSAQVVIATPDGGFNAEVDALCNHFFLKREDLFIVRIDREGKTFAGDSREYINNPNIHVINDGTPEDLFRKVKYSLDLFLKSD